jgi:hypothetical protein
MDESVIDKLIKARESNPTEVYDEVFWEVTRRIADAKSVGKADIGSLLFWKRLRADTRWARELNSESDATVRMATADAREAALDSSLSTPEAASAARRALSRLPGFRTGDALASAVITAAAPERMAVYDKRAHDALRHVVGRKLGNQAGRYGRYMTEVGELLDAVRLQRPDWTARDVDLALFWLGGRG